MSVRVFILERGRLVDSIITGASHSYIIFLGRVLFRELIFVNKGIGSCIFRSIWSYFLWIVILSYKVLMVDALNFSWGI
jgi:hypothetical protein